MPPARPRIFIVEDDDAVRRALVRVFSTTPELALVGDFASAEEVLRAVREGLDADVAAVDLQLPNMLGHQLIRTLRKLRPKLESIVITAFDDDDSLYGALRAGASGYLLKTTPPPVLVAAALEAASGGAPMSPAIARRIISEFRGASEAAAAPITAREREVLTLLTTGATYPHIGVTLNISTSTVQTHIRSIYRKLEVSTKAEATAEAYRRRVIR